MPSRFRLDGISRRLILRHQVGSGQHEGQEQRLDWRNREAERVKRPHGISLDDDAHPDTRPTSLSNQPPLFHVARGTCHQSENDGQQRSSNHCKPETKTVDCHFAPAVECWYGIEPSVILAYSENRRRKLVTIWVRGRRPDFVILRVPKDLCKLLAPSGARSFATLRMTAEMFGITFVEESPFSAARAVLAA